MNREEREIHQGVQVARTFRYFDRYTGTPQALIAAGLVAADELPGAPGCGKMVTTVRAGGRVPPGKRPRCDGLPRFTPGYKVIRKVREDRFVVELTVSHAEQARRLAERQHQQDLRSDKALEASLSVESPPAANIIPFPLKKCHSRLQASETAHHVVEVAHADLDALSALVVSCSRTAFEALVLLQKLLPRSPPGP